MTIALTIYAVTTKTDITMKGSAIFVVAVAFLIFTLFATLSNNLVQLNLIIDRSHYNRCFWNIVVCSVYYLRYLDYSGRKLTRIRY